MGDLVGNEALLEKDSAMGQVRIVRGGQYKEEEVVVDATSLLGEQKPNEQTDNSPQQYRSYPQRWWLLTVAVLLNLANYSHWVSFPSVTKVAAKYYDQSGEAMDLIPTLSYGLGVPCCLVATYVVERFGLKAGLHIGGSLTGLGGMLCFFSSLPGLSDGLSSDAKYYLALVGQALTGVACPFISCVPTKISQHWFGDAERTVATILVGMSNPLGIVLGEAVTPLIVRQPQDVAYMNTVWFVPAALGSVITAFKVTANRPPTPPSPSAAAAAQQEGGRRASSYLPNIKALLKNKAFLILFLFVGGAMGYVSTVSTKIEQIMCSRGYSDQLSGLSGSLILLVGFFASFPMGLLAYKTGRLTLICKLACSGGIVALICLAYFLRLPGVGGAIVASCVALGFFALGCYPLALELVVEATYPVDQATGTAFIFLSSALQGVFLMQIENSFGRPLTEEEMSVQTCVGPDDHGHQQPKDYSSYLNFITAYMASLIVVFILFFRTELKRTNADRARAAMTNVATATTIVAADSRADVKALAIDQEQGLSMSAAAAASTLLLDDRSESTRSDAETAETVALSSSASSSTTRGSRSSSIANA